MQRARRTFTREFKVEALQLVKTSNKPMTQTARDLDIADSILYHWCQRFSEHGEHTSPGSGHQTPQEEEIRQLKRENELLRQERDTLKESYQHLLVQPAVKFHFIAEQKPEVPDYAALSDALGLGEWLVCLKNSSGALAGPRRCQAYRRNSSAAVSNTAKSAICHI